MSLRKPGAEWGDARVAFGIIAPQVEEAIRSGRSARSVYEEMKSRFPAGYAQFAKYVRRSVSRMRVGEPAISVEHALEPPTTLHEHRPARLKHSRGLDWRDYIT